MYENTSIKLTENISTISKVLITFKVVILIVSIVWIILLGVMKVIDENSEHYDKLAKTTKILDDTIFSMVIFLIFSYALSVIYVFRHSAWYIFTQIFSDRILNNIFGIKTYKKYSLVPRLHISFFWWINVWLILLSGFSVIAKITNEVKWILFLL